MKKEKPYVKVWNNAPKKHQERMVLNYLLSMVENQMPREKDSSWESYMLSRAWESLNHTLRGGK